MISLQLTHSWHAPLPFLYFMQDGPLLGVLWDQHSKASRFALHKFSVATSLVGLDGFRLLVILGHLLFQALGNFCPLFSLVRRLSLLDAIIKQKIQAKQKIRSIFCYDQMVKKCQLLRSYLISYKYQATYSSFIRLSMHFFSFGYSFLLDLTILAI